MKINLIRFKTILSTLRLVFKNRFFRPKKAFVYVAIGDSTVEGMGATHKDNAFATKVFYALSKHIKNAEHYNLGKSGARVKDVLHNQLDQAIMYKPDLIIISVGANDLRNRTKFSQFKIDYEYLLRRLKNETKAIILVNNIPNLMYAPIMPKYYTPYCWFLTRKFNQAIADSTKSTDGILVDLHSQSKTVKDKKEVFAEDGLHPSDIGHSLWSELIITVLQPLLLKNYLTK